MLRHRPTSQPPPPSPCTALLCNYQTISSNTDALCSVSLNCYNVILVCVDIKSYCSDNIWLFSISKVIALFLKKSFYSECANFKYSGRVPAAN